MFDPTLPFSLLTLSDPHRPFRRTADLAQAAGGPEPRPGSAAGGNTDLPVLQLERRERRARARQRLAERVRRKAA